MAITICLWDVYKKPYDEGYGLYGDVFGGFGEKTRWKYIGMEGGYLYDLAKNLGSEIDRDHDQMFLSGNVIKIWETKTGEGSGTRFTVFGQSGSPGGDHFPNCYTFEPNPGSLIWQGNFVNDIWVVNPFNNCSIESTGQHLPVCKVYYEGYWNNFHGVDVGDVITVKLGPVQPWEWHRFETKLGKIGYYHSTGENVNPFRGAEWYQKISTLQSWLQTCTRGRVFV